MLENKLYSFNSLSENWDGYGAASVDAQAITNSVKFIEILPEHLIDNVKTDDIRLTPYGTIVIDWKNSKGELISTEIGNKTFGFFSVFNDKIAPQIDRVDFNENYLPEELYTAFNKLFKK
jgi:hypothetical protein